MGLIYLISHKVKNGRAELVFGNLVGLRCYADDNVFVGIAMPTY